MFERAKEILDQGFGDGLYSGAAAGILQGDEILWTGYTGRTGFEETDRLVSVSTRFDLASVTKIVSTTMIALRLLDRGLLRLEDRVSDFFPEAESVQAVTVRQLLTHTSGLPAHFLLENEIEHPDQIRRLLLTRPLAAPSGSVESYSCMGYILLGEILKAISGKPLDELFRDEVGKPLGLQDTVYAPAASLSKDIAKTKDARTGMILQGVVHDENARFQNGISANAGLFSTVPDLLTFGKMLVSKGRVNDQAYLSPAVLEAASQNYTAGMEEDRGLGFYLASNRGSSLGDLAAPDGFGHTGFTGTSFLVVPRYSLCVVFLCNRALTDQDSRRTVRLRALLHNSIIAEISFQQQNNALAFIQCR